MGWDLPFVNIELYKRHEKVVLAGQFMQIIQERMRLIPMGRTELAEKLGITPNYLSSLLSGKRVPTLELLAGFQFVLRIRFSVTLNGTVNFSNVVNHGQQDIREERAEELFEPYFLKVAYSELAGAQLNDFTVKEAFAVY
ncbi:helix-turn-helix domain-containing protein [Gynurincola endophyticus]|jgi:transcriptional regulator with XRE-family HTH domain|uniref:helix-turn-helix domain-containing protein n=1 Tax=Gynurincola endophyticus TaxID=2479004 RepID=UPI000F8F6E78|nr:helix-turn-helix domain-containing protein [Gynurincola endophyticus]